MYIFMNDYGPIYSFWLFAFETFSGNLDNCHTNNHNMTRFGKTLFTGFLVKIEFDAYLISSTIELTHLPVLVHLRASLWS